jgi:hypothetical protein
MFQVKRAQQLLRFSLPFFAELLFEQRKKFRDFTGPGVENYLPLRENFFKDWRALELRKDYGSDERCGSSSGSWCASGGLAPSSEAE